MATIRTPFLHPSTVDQDPTSPLPIAIVIAAVEHGEFWCVFCWRQSGRVAMSSRWWRWHYS
jgi:hypothetical protein